MRRIERFGDLLVPTLNGVQRPNGAGQVPPSSPLSAGGEYDLYGIDRAPRGARMAETTGVILGTQEARRIFLATGEVVSAKVARQRAVSAWEAAGGTRERLFARTDDDVVVWQWARLVPPNPQVSYQNPNVTEIDLTWKIYGDTWNGLRHGRGIELDVDPPDETGFDEGLVLDYDGSKWDTEFALPDHATYTTKTLTLYDDGVTPPLNNGGNADVTNIVCTITTGFDEAMIGTDADPIVLNINGTVWRYSNTINIGQRLIVHGGSSAVWLATELIDDFVQDDTVLLVLSNTSYEAGQMISIDLDDGTTHESRIVSVAGASTVTILHPLPSAASMPNTVRVGTYASFVEPAYRMEWMVLRPGDNPASLKYLGGGMGGTASIKFDYYDAHA